MHIWYEDITKRIDQPPVWWLNGVPRYDDFKPSDVNVYAREVALVRIECQSCFKQFDIAVFSPSPRGDEWMSRFDDPPRHSVKRADYEREDCTGATMGGQELRILQFWSKSGPVTDWERIKGREVLIQEPSINFLNLKPPSDH